MFIQSGVGRKNSGCCLSEEKPDVWVKGKWINHFKCPAGVTGGSGADGSDSAAPVRRGPNRGSAVRHHAGNPRAFAEKVYSESPPQTKLISVCTGWDGPCARRRVIDKHTQLFIFQSEAALHCRAATEAQWRHVSVRTCSSIKYNNDSCYNYLQKTINFSLFWRILLFKWSGTVIGTGTSQSHLAEAP